MPDVRRRAEHLVHLKTRVAVRAQLFRGVLETLDRSLLPPTFSQFPRGSCGDASLLLGAYLSDLGLGPFIQVLGFRPNPEQPASPTSHAWLRSGTSDLIVDITASQFPEVVQPVIVTAHSVWHERLSPHDQGPGDFRHYQGPAIPLLHSAYAAILLALGPSA